MDIEQIALEVAQKCGVDPLYVVMEEHADGTQTVLDHRPLFIKFAKALIARLTRDAEPVGEIVKATGSLKDIHIIQWQGEFSPNVGDKLFLHPPLTQQVPNMPNVWHKKEMVEVIKKRFEQKEESK